MIAVTDFLSLLITTFLFQPGLSSTIPIQVDLVFPRNNTVYQPVYPFPFVFAFHNFSTAWKYKPSVYWAFRIFIPMTGEERFVEDGFIGYNLLTTQSTWAPPPDKFLAINASKIPSQDIQYTRFPDVPPNPSNQTSRILEYSISFSSPICSNLTERRERILFNTGLSFGAMPYLNAFGSCPPVSAAAISIEGDGKSQMNKTCIQLTSPNPIPCAFTVDQQTLDQVSKEMVQLTKCSNVTWPNGTGIGSQCTGGKSLRSESHVLRWDYSAIGISIIILAMISNLA